ncbi:MAG: universal stress protein [Duodenibacillus sp.]|nr:universal stress protein [Duodenibacillus sp.]
MFQRILVPVDGSALSLQAVAGAADLAAKAGCEIVLLTVVEPFTCGADQAAGPQSEADYDKGMREVADERLSLAIGICGKSGLRPRAKAVKSYSPAEAIVDEAEAENCDCIFMASHGRHGLAAMLLGSETQKVLTHTKLPVMVYR